MMGLTTQPLWSLFRREKRVGFTNEVMLSVFREHGVIRKDSLENYNRTAENRDIYQLVEPGWFVVNRMKAWQGSVGIAFERGTVSGHYLCFRPTHEEDASYLNYVLRAPEMTALFAKLSRGVRPGQAEIDNDLLRLVPVPLPVRDVQTATAAFLDDQLSRLNAALLARRRNSSLASEAVEGRVRHLLLGGGEVRAESFDNLPSGWNVWPLKAAFQVIDCKHRTAEYVQQGIPVISPGDVRPGRLRLEEATRFVSEEDYLDLADDLRRCRVGDIVYSRNASAGTAAYVDSADRFTMGQDVCRITSTTHSGLFMSHVLNYLVQPQLEAARVGSTITRINIDQIRGLSVPLPPVEVQLAIARDVDVLLEARAEMATQEQKQRDILEERKRALITACITGQFDVATAGPRAAEAALHGVTP